MGSSRLRFSPRRRPESGLYRFDIGTAGSTALLLHALVPALCTARPTNDGKSILHLIGGTHQPLAPSAGYLREVWATAAQAVPQIRSRCN